MKFLRVFTLVASTAIADDADPLKRVINLEPMDSRSNTIIMTVSRPSDDKNDKDGIKCKDMIRAPKEGFNTKSILDAAVAEKKRITEYSYSNSSSCVLPNGKEPSADNILDERVSEKTLQEVVNLVNPPKKPAEEGHPQP
jgi:hypothetical protein